MLSKGQNERNQMEMVWFEDLVPKDHLLRQIDRAVDFGKIYEMVRVLYGKDNVRPSIDPVVLVKMVLNQHLYGLPSLRRTAADVVTKLGMNAQMYTNKLRNGYRRKLIRYMSKNTNG